MVDSVTREGGVGGVSPDATRGISEAEKSPLPAGLEGRTVRADAPGRGRLAGRVRFQALKLWSDIKSLFSPQKAILAVPHQADQSNSAAGLRLLSVLGTRRGGMKETLHFCFQLTGQAEADGKDIKTAEKHISPSLDKMSSMQLYRLHKQLSKPAMAALQTQLAGTEGKSETAEGKFVGGQNEKMGRVIGWLKENVDAKLSERGFDTGKATPPNKPGASTMNKVAQAVQEFNNEATKSVEIGHFKADKATVTRMASDIADAYGNVGDKAERGNARAVDGEGNPLNITRQFARDLLRAQEPIMFVSASGQEEPLFTPFSTSIGAGGVVGQQTEDAFLNEFSDKLTNLVSGGDGGRALSLSNILHQGTEAALSTEIMAGASLNGGEAGKSSPLMQMKSLFSAEMPAFQNNRKSLTLRQGADGQINVECHLKMNSHFMPAKEPSISRRLEGVQNQLKNTPRFDFGKSQLDASFEIAVPKEGKPTLSKEPEYSARFVSRGYIPGVLSHEIDIPQEENDY